MFDCNLGHTHGLQKWSLWICAAKNKQFGSPFGANVNQVSPNLLNRSPSLNRLYCKLEMGFFTTRFYLIHIFLTLVAGFRIKKTSSGNRFVSVEDVAWMPQKQRVSSSCGDCQNASVLTKRTTVRKAVETSSPKMASPGSCHSNNDHHPKSGVSVASIY